MRRAISRRRRAVAAETFAGAASDVIWEDWKKSGPAASARLTPGIMPVAVTAAVDVSNRRRSIFNGKSVLAIRALLWNEGPGATAMFADLSATSPFPGNHRAWLSRLVRAPALVLMLAGGWNREKKGVKDPGSVPRVKSPEEGGSAKRIPEEGLLVPRDVPDGPNQYQRVGNSGTL